MASWIDIISLVITLAVVAGLVCILILLRNIAKGIMTTTNEKFKSKGVTISDHGISVKTNKRMDHSDYLDVTQREFIKAYKTSTHGPGAGPRTPSSESVHSSHGLHIHSHRGSDVSKGRS